MRPDPATSKVTNALTRACGAAAARGGRVSVRSGGNGDGLFLFCVFFLDDPFSQLPVIVCWGHRACFCHFCVKSGGKNTRMNFWPTWQKIRESVVFSDLIRGWNRVKSRPRPSCFRKRQVSSPACPRGVSTYRGQKMLQHLRCPQRERQRTCPPLRTPLVSPVLQCWRSLNVALRV